MPPLLFCSRVAYATIITQIVDQDLIDWLTVSGATCFWLTVPVRKSKSTGKSSFSTLCHGVHQTKHYSSDKSKIWNYIVGAQKVTWNDIPQHNRNSHKVEYIVLSLNSESHCFPEKKQKMSPYWYLLSNKNPPKSSSIHKQHEKIATINLSTLLYRWILKICFCSSIYASTRDTWIPACLWQHIISKHHEGPWFGSVELILFKEYLKQVFSLQSFSAG